MHLKKQNGFSLVELSIVLVILGLLTGGILAGQSLIRAAELRAVTTEFQRYYTAGQAFRDKYFQLPGDFRDATRFWGRLNSNTDCGTNSAAAVATPGACDGNGDGTISWGGAGSQSSEGAQVWKQLANAGLIEGNYTGLTGAGGGVDFTPGTNVPKSKMNNAGWSVYNPLNTMGNFSGGAQWYAGSYGNALIFGSKIATNLTQGQILKPEEAWNIDTKMDDGKPGTGKVIASEDYWFQSPAAAGQCTTSASATDYSGTYNLSNSAIICALDFPLAF